MAKDSVCYGITFLRMEVLESGLNGWNSLQSNAFLTGNANSTADGCHPNTEGYRRYYVPQLISLFERILPRGDA